MAELASVEADSRSRAVLPGHPKQRFVIRKSPDGRVLLQPVVVITDAQLMYDSDPDLREQRARATASPAVRRARTPRT